MPRRAEDDYPLVINARVDVFLPGFIAGEEPGTQASLVPEALRRGSAYLDAGADCVYPVAIWESDALRHWLGSECPGEVGDLPVP